MGLLASTRMSCGRWWANSKPCHITQGVRAAGVPAQRQHRATEALEFSHPSNLRTVKAEPKGMGRDLRQGRRDPQMGHGSRGHPKQQI